MAELGFAVVYVADASVCLNQLRQVANVTNKAQS